ncbi:MAG: hypothetical protein QG568_416 [Patescibacteria group bacterium]|nr:hypothetical protein [Patescibacteria group bacterium]
MKTTKTLTLAIALFCFFLGIGTQASTAQEQSEYATMLDQIIKVIKVDSNKMVTHSGLSTETLTASAVVYQISKEVCGKHLTIQHIPAVNGESIGNISFSWNDPGKKVRATTDWFISLHLDGTIDAAFDPKNDKMMTSSGGKVVDGVKHKEFWESEAHQIIRGLHKLLIQPTKDEAK